MFGYGSLIWKPPCAAELVEEAFIGSITGWHRRFWQTSIDHRGTPERPGRVSTIERERRGAGEGLKTAPHPTPAAPEKREGGRGMGSCGGGSGGDGDIDALAAATVVVMVVMVLWYRLRGWW